MDLLLTAPDLDSQLAAELRRNYGTAGASIREGLFQLELPISDEPSPPLVFSRQWLPSAVKIVQPSIRAAAETVENAVVGTVAEDRPWRLHVFPHYGGAAAQAGLQRAKLIEEALLERLQKRRRHLLKRLSTANSPFSTGESLVQFILLSPEEGFLSIAPAPLPASQYRLISPFRKGSIPVASDQSAPSRAFAKLVEAELRLGRSVERGESCVDLGASPGSWSYVALRRGATVHAVDRSPLREDLMSDPLLAFHQGDAFSYTPPQTADWLLCDVIAAPERSIGLIQNWLSRGWCRHFIVTIKFKGDDEYGKLEGLKRDLATLASRWSIGHLCANKNEACAFGNR